MQPACFVYIDTIVDMRLDQPSYWFMEICWKTLALSLRNLNRWIKLNFMDNPDINFHEYLWKLSYTGNVLYALPIQFVAGSLGSWGPSLNLSLCSLVNPALRSMLPNLSLAMEFLENVFTNFIFEKLLSHEALRREELQLSVTIKRSFVTSYKWKKLVRAIQAASTPSEANSLPKLFHILNHFH